jgi:hypothetical protein
MSNTHITGYYNRNFIKENPDNNISTIPAWLEQYPNNTTIVAVESYRMPPVITALDNALFYEVYTWITYNDSSLTKKLGEITYNSLYPDSGSGTISQPSIQTMTVLGADGIYSGVTSVVMDFTAPPIRTIKFNY